MGLSEQIPSFDSTIPSKRNAVVRTPSQSTIIMKSIGTDRSEKTVQTQIRLLLKEQSDQDLFCLLFCQQLLNAILHCKIQLYNL